MIWRLIRNSSKKYYGRSLLVVGVLCISMMATILLWWMYSNLEHFLFQQSGLYEYDYVLEIKDKGSRGGIVENKNTDTSTFDSIIKDQTLQQKYVISQVSIPAQAQLRFADQQIGSDIIIFSISDSFFGSFDPTGTIPIAISETMLNLYNTQIANETVLPKISAAIIKILNIDIVFGVSGIFNIQGPSITKRAKIANVSGNLPIGFVIPESVARSIVQELNQGSISPYKVIVVVDTPEQIPLITQKYSNDFIVQSNYDKIEAIQNRIKGVRYFFIIINISIMLVLVSFFIYTTFSIIEQNKRSFRVYRLHGATPQFILGILLGQIASYTVAASICTVGSLLVVFYYLTPAINDLIIQSYGISFVIQSPTFQNYIYTAVAHLAIFGLMTTLFALPERSKKFENK